MDWKYEKVGRNNRALVGFFSVVNEMYVQGTEILTGLWKLKDAGISMKTEC